MPIVDVAGNTAVVRCQSALLRHTRAYQRWDKDENTVAINVNLATSLGTVTY